MTTTLARAAGAGGQVLAEVVRGIAAVRPAAKPLHPRGVVVAGRVERLGSPVPTGSPWLDEPGFDHVLVRRSRAVGLPAPLPDIHGLAVRVPVSGDAGDLLLAGTGHGPVTRHLLRPGVSGRGWLTTLLPYRTPSGLVVLGARWTTAETADLCWSAAGHRTWHVFGRLWVADADVDAPVDFDPVLQLLPGLALDEWVGRLREPAYALARRRRGRRVP